MTMNNVGNGTIKKRVSYGYGKAIVIFNMIVLLFCILSLVYHGIFSTFKLSSSIWTSPSKASILARYQDQSHQKEKPITHWDPQSSTPHIESKISCDRSHYHYDLCSIKGPTVLDPTTSTFYAIGPTNPKHFIQKIRPYPRKWEAFTMSKIKEFTLLSGPQSPQCDIIHNTSAIVFSAGGYTGNFFHDFNEGFLPLFITVRSMSLTNQDVVLVIEKSRDWWVSKYSDLLAAFSNYPIINLDNDINETNTHCFKSVTLGLISHGFMTIDPNMLPKPTTLVDFHYFLSKAYGKAQHSVSLHSMDQPNLVLISRPNAVGRAILNQVEITSMAKKMGFNVIIFEPKPETPLSETYRLLNKSHVMIGVHGAALTHLLFLRPGSIFIQVVPIGTDSIAEMCYERPAKEMGLEYLEYKVRLEESSLVSKYNKDDPILHDPMTLQKNGWALVKKVYLKEQNVQLNLFRFKKFLKYAYRKAKRFMHKVG